MKVLVTGGAGYIGSTICSALLDSGIQPVILDNLVTGRAEYVNRRTWYRGDIADGEMIDRIFIEHPDIEATIHCAGLIVVPESVAKPLLYHRENVSKSVAMITHLLRNNCRKIIFSSTAALYGVSSEPFVSEASPVAPASPYAYTKLVIEQVLADCANAGELRAVALRYFNPIGADPAMRTGSHAFEPSHVLGRMIRAWETAEPFVITGVDWPTPDGTCVRDYVHVWDLAEAHVAALIRFDEAAGDLGFNVINLGSGMGTSVRDLLAEFSHVIGATVPFVEAGRRPGDVIGSFALIDQAERVLRWRPRLSVREAIGHAIEWRERLLALDTAVGKWPGLRHELGTLVAALPETVE